MEGSFGLASCGLFDGPVWVAPNGSHLGSFGGFRLGESQKPILNAFFVCIFLGAFLGSLCCFRPGAFGLSWSGLGRVYLIGTSFGGLGDLCKLLGRYLGASWDLSWAS